MSHSRVIFFDLQDPFELNTVKTFFLKNRMELYWKKLRQEGYLWRSGPGSSVLDAANKSHKSLYLERTEDGEKRTRRGTPPDELPEKRKQD